MPLESKKIYYSQGVITYTNLQFVSFSFWILIEQAPSNTFLSLIRFLDLSLSIGLDHSYHNGVNQTSSRKEKSTIKSIIYRDIQTRQIEKIKK